MNHTDPNIQLGALLKLRCPLCGAGKLFNGFFDSPQRCPNCGYFFMRENGYFLPHVPIGYAATVVVALSVWPLLYFVFHVQNSTLTLSTMVVAAIVFGAWFIRYSKVIWLAIDLKLNPPTSEDFAARGRSI